MSEIIELATERTIEQNLASIGSEYFENFNKNHLPIIGTIDKVNKKLILVADESVHQELMQIVNSMNARSINAI